MDYGTLSKKYAHGTTNMVTLQRTKGSNGRVNTGTAGYMLVTIVEQMLCVSLTDSLFFSFFCYLNEQNNTILGFWAKLEAYMYSISSCRASCDKENNSTRR